MAKGQQALQMKAEGKTNAEIAAELGMPKPSVRRLISEAKSASKFAGVAWQLFQPVRQMGESAPQAPDDEADAKAAFAREATKPTERPRRFIIIPDTQVKPGVPTDHLYWAGRYIAEKRPDVVVHLGDHWDMPSLSSYEKPGSAYFEGKRVKADIDSGNAALERLSEGMGPYRPNRMVLLRGNHEDRLRRALNDEPRLQGLVGYEDFKDTTLGWEVHDFLRPVEIEGIWLSHYFANPLTGRPYSGNPETVLKNVGHSFIQGHQQGLKMSRRELATGEVQRALIAGSFYEHDEDYLNYQGNKHWRGILVLNEVADGNWDQTEVSLGFLRREFKETA